MRDVNIPVFMGMVSFFALVMGLNYSFSIQQEQARAAFKQVSERPELCGTRDQPQGTQRLCEAVLDLRRVAQEFAGLGLLEQDRPVFDRIVREGIRRDLDRAAGIDKRGLSGAPVDETAVSLLAARAGSLRAAKRTVSIRIEVMTDRDRSRTILESVQWL